jgi:hypothetical protein
LVAEHGIEDGEQAAQPPSDEPRGRTRYSSAWLAFGFDCIWM